MGNKKTRRDKIKKYIFSTGSIPQNLKKLSKKFGISESTLRNDLNEITPELFQQISQRLSLETLFETSKRIQEMTNSELIQMVTCFIRKNKTSETDNEPISINLLNFEKEKNHD